MSIISWNYQGMGPPWKLQFLKDVVRQQRPIVVFLCETLSNKEKMEWVRTRSEFQGMVVVEAQGRSGGLSMLWRNRDHVKLLSVSSNHIDVEILEPGMHPWRLTGFYGEPNRNQRRRTWDLLRNLSRDSNLPWCVLDDLNNITYQSDKKGGAPYPQWLLDGFYDTLADIGLLDVELVGHPFTWERGRGIEAWLEVRLDHALVSQSWFDLFPYAKLYNLEGSPSDHSVICLETICRGSSVRKQRFKFENA